MADTKQYRRKRKIIDPELQFGLMLYALMAGGVAVLIHGLLVTRAISQLAMEGKKGDELLTAVPGIVVIDSLITMAVLIPIVILIGRQITLRLAGPLYRFRVFLRSVIDGEEAEPCRIRKGDLFVDLCDLINGATIPARQRNAALQERRRLKRLSEEGEDRAA